MTDKHKEALEADIAWLEGLNYPAWEVEDYASIENVCNAARKSLQAASWQPIETCQKEKGKPILLLDIEGVKDVGWWNDGFKNRDGYFMEATHWMPLPAAPVDGGG